MHTRKAVIAVKRSLRRPHLTKSVNGKQYGKKMVFKYRIVKKDGHSFYRGVIFNFLENVIFSKNILLMKEILILFSEKISEENPIIKEKNFLINSLKKIKKNKVINILYIIIRYMEIHYNILYFYVCFKISIIESFKMTNSSRLFIRIRKIFT